MGARDFSRDVTRCAGYVLGEVEETDDCIKAKLTLAGKSGNAYGNDIAELTLNVEYQDSGRLHVHILDKEQRQYQIPADLFPRPAGTAPSANHDLAFEHTPPGEVFAFWIVRRSTGEVIFDSRPSSIPTHSDPLTRDGEELRDTTMPAHPLIFEDQCLQLSTALPPGANIYGLGEYNASSGFRRDPEGTVQTMWNRDAGVPKDENSYGSHPFYLEQRDGKAHGVFLLNSHGMDVIVRKGVLQYRAIGGTLDLYFLRGPTPVAVVEQYSEIVGKPLQAPDWALGFHLCRYGWKSVEETKEVVLQMEKARIPLETIWNDLDYMDRSRNFELRDSFREMREFTEWVHERKQHFIPIVDAAIGIPEGKGDKYATYEEGHEKGVFIKNEDGTAFVGKVWPGPTVFPDWTHGSTLEWWQKCFDQFEDKCHYDGIWIDMNEPASFTDAPIKNDPRAGHRGDTGKTFLGQLAEGVRDAAKLITASTAGSKASDAAYSLLDLPPYAIHSGFDTLGSITVGPTCVLADGSRHYNAHNMYGYTEALTTAKVLEKQAPGKRHFIVSRSTFAGQGRASAHWLGDNKSTWQDMHDSIQGVLQFQLFQVPMVGADVGGFAEDCTEELMNRWMQLGAFQPFFRNHNDLNAKSQEPYLWPSVAAASRNAILGRYSLLPYWETLFHHSHKRGTPVIQPLFFNFPGDHLLDVDRQFMLGDSIIVTPALEPGVDRVKGYFPKEGAPWTCFWTHKAIKKTPDDMCVLSAPLGHINVHVRAGTILLLYDDPKDTLAATKAECSYRIVAFLDEKGCAAGSVTLDDGSTVDGESLTMRFTVRNGFFSMKSEGPYRSGTNIRKITLVNHNIKKKMRDVVLKEEIDTSTASSEVSLEDDEDGEKAGEHSEE